MWAVTEPSASSPHPVVDVAGGHGVEQGLGAVGQRVAVAEDRPVGGEVDPAGRQAPGQRLDVAGLARIQEGSDQWFLGPGQDAVGTGEVDGGSCVGEGGGAEPWGCRRRRRGGLGHLTGVRVGHRRRRRRRRLGRFEPVEQGAEELRRRGRRSRQADHREAGGGRLVIRDDGQVGEHQAGSEHRVVVGELGVGAQGGVGGHGGDRGADRPAVGIVGVAGLVDGCRGGEVEQERPGQRVREVVGVERLERRRRRRPPARCRGPTATRSDRQAGADGDPCRARAPAERIVERAEAPRPQLGEQGGIGLLPGRLVDGHPRLAEQLAGREGARELVDERGVLRDQGGQVLRQHGQVEAQLGVGGERGGDGGAGLGEVVGHRGRLLGQGAHVDGLVTEPGHHGDVEGQLLGVGVEGGQAHEVGVQGGHRLAVGVEHVDGHGVHAGGVERRHDPVGVGGDRHHEAHRPRAAVERAGPVDPLHVAQRLAVDGAGELRAAADAVVDLQADRGAGGRRRHLQRDLEVEAVAHPGGAPEEPDGRCLRCTGLRGGGRRRAEHERPEDEGGDGRGDRAGEPHQCFRSTARPPGCRSKPSRS